MATKSSEKQYNITTSLIPSYISFVGQNPPNVTTATRW